MLLCPSRGYGRERYQLDRLPGSYHSRKGMSTVARVKHTYTFRPFRTLGFLLYMQTPSLSRQPDGTIEVLSVTEFTLRAHLANSKYVREDLRVLEKLGLLESLELGHNRATLRVKLPLGMVWSHEA